MKKTLIVSLCAIAAMVSVSCAKSELSNAPLAGKRVPAVINAISNGTKLTINDLQTSWEMGDSISVFASDGKSEGTYFSDDSGTSVTFTGTKGESDILKYAIFPANSDATCDAMGVINTTIPSEQDGTISNTLAMATEFDGDFEFNNVASVIKITIPNDMNGINFVCFTADTTIAGDVTIADFVAVPSAEAVNKYRRVSIYKNGADIKGDQYLTVIPGTYSGVVTLGKKDGNVRYTAAIKVTGKTFTVNKIRNFGTVSNTTAWVANALPGVFSIAKDTRVLMAQGDIRYHRSGNSWNIADTYERLTTNPLEKSGDDFVNDEIDLFSWNNADTPGTFKDNGTSNPSSWRDEGDWTKKLTVSGWSIRTNTEMGYFFSGRHTVNQKIGSAISSTGAVADRDNYCIIYPDGWAGDFLPTLAYTNVLTNDELKKLEDQGCAICPLGHRINKDGSGFSKTPDRYFWTTSWQKVNKGKGAVFVSRVYYDATNSVFKFDASRGVECKYGCPVRPFFEIK